jgi:hypothetical protein
VLDNLQGAHMKGISAHKVMDEYLKYHFFEHPAIATVLARPLAASAVLPDDFISKIGKTGY